MQEAVQFRNPNLPFPMKVGTYDVLVDAHVAKELLKLNKANRPLKPRTVEWYASQMSNDAWEFTGEPIIVGAHGLLVNGQHRLHAIIKSDVQLQLTIRVLDEASSLKAFAVVDTGKKRQAADVLALSGVEAYHTAVAASAKLIWMYQTNKTATQWATNQQILNIVTDNPGLVDSARIINTQYRHVTLLIPKSSAVFCYYLFNLIDQELCDDFFQKLTFGLNLTEDNPITTLRRTLERARTTTRGRGFTDNRWASCILIKTWNAVLANSQVSVLRMGASEPFTQALNQALKKVSL